MHHLRYEIYKVAIIVKCKHKTLCDYLRRPRARRSLFRVLLTIKRVISHTIIIWYWYKRGIV